MAFGPDNRFQGGSAWTQPFGRSAAVDAAQLDEGLRAYMLRVYNWMASGLLLTGIVAYLIANTGAADLFYQVVRTPRGNAVSPTILGWIAMFSPLVFVLVLSFGINKLSGATAQLLFWVFAAVMGLSLSSIFMVYTDASIAKVFFISAATFGAMSLYGYTTKRDLTGVGNFLIMGLIGLIIASLVNIFMQSSMLDFAISAIGVLIFVGLTAYDTQKIKESYDQGLASEMLHKTAVMGALSLYLDFINLFMMLLRLFGNRE